MATKKAGISAGKSTALATIKPQALTSDREMALAAVLGSDGAIEKMPGSGGEVARQEGVTRVTGREYATSAGTVPASEIYFVHGAKPNGDGIWLGEADKVAWVDPATGFECIMMRDNPLGFLSGYVGVPASHPLFGWQHDAIPSDLGIEVHGGLTYSKLCQEGPTPQLSLIYEARRICHVLVGAVPLKHATDHRPHPDRWWFGFSCDHVYDVDPGERQDRRRFMGAETSAMYRDDGYVVREILNLTGQLRAIADGQPITVREGPPLPAVGLDPRRGG